MMKQIFKLNVLVKLLIVFVNDNHLNLKVLNVMKTTKVIYLQFWFIAAKIFHLLKDKFMYY